MNKNPNELLTEVFDILHEIRNDEDKLLRLLDFLKNGGLEEPEPFENGLYHDDGTKINESTIPVPNMCLVCKSHYSDDWDENILCKLNREDQADNIDNFKCGAFEKTPE
jgi:hypothetical protein